MKTQSVLKLALCAAGFTAFAVGAQAQVVLLNENFDESLPTTTVSDGSYQSITDGQSPVVGSGIGAALYNNGTVSGAAGLVAGSSQSLEYTPASGGIYSLFEYAPGAALPSTGLLVYSDDFKINGDVSSGGSLRYTQLTDYTGGTAFFINYVGANGSETLSNGSSYITTASGLINFSDALQETFTMNMDTQTYDFDLYDLTTGSPTPVIAENDLAFQPGVTIGGAANYVYDFLYDQGQTSTQLDNLTLATESIPEPSTVALVGLGALGLAFLIRRHRTA